MGITCSTQGERKRVAIKLKSTGEYIRAIKVLRQYADGFTSVDAPEFDLRHFTEFNNPLTRSQKDKVRRYFDVYQRHAAYKGVKWQQFRDPKNLRDAQKAMGMPTKQTWRGVFVPEPSPDTAAGLVRYGKKYVIEYRYQGVDTIFVPFDRMAFAMGGAMYVYELFKDAPASYLYNLDMGYGRNRWKLGGNLRQMLEDLDRIVNLYGHYDSFVMGAHVYRGGRDAFEKLRAENFKTMGKKKMTQDMIKKQINAERKKRARREFTLALDKNNVRRGYMTPAAFRRKYGVDWFSKL